MSSFWFGYMTFVSQMGEPNLFFLTQIFTLGGSDLRDFSIVYMSEIEAFLYFTINTIDMSFGYPYAVLHTGAFGLIYFIMGVVEVFNMFYESDDKKGGKGGKGGKGKYMNKDGKEYNKDDMKDSEGNFDTK